jgi:hypothetical protein
MLSCIFCCLMPQRRVWKCDDIVELCDQVVDAREVDLEWRTYFVKFEEQRNNLPNRAKNELDIIYASYDNRATMIAKIKKVSLRFPALLEHNIKKVPDPTDPIYIQTLPLQNYYDEIWIAIDNNHLEEVTKIISKIAEEEYQLILKTIAAVEQSELYLAEFSMHYRTCPICKSLD